MQWRGTWIALAAAVSLALAGSAWSLTLSPGGDDAVQDEALALVDQKIDASVVKDDLDDLDDKVEKSKKAKAKKTKKVKSTKGKDDSAGGAGGTAQILAPEPNTFLMLGIGLAGLAGAERRRRQQR